MTVTLDKKAIVALISMLDEPDINVYKQIKEKLLSGGIKAVPILKNALDNTFDNIVQQRIETIINEIRLKNIYSELRNWCQSDNRNLLEGHIILTQYQYPDLNIIELKERFDKVRKDVWLELNDNLTALETVKVLNHILFEIYKFTNNKHNINAPNNSYLNNLLESKKGNSISLGIIYIIIAHELNIPIYGVNLPEHFILCYANKIIEEKVSYIEEDNILFYLNPSKNGAVFTRREVDLFINQLKLKPERSFYSPCNNIEIIKRLLKNLISDYKKLGFKNKISDLEYLMGALM